MKPVFANSAWINSPERLILRTGRWQRRRLQVRYGLFIHPTEGPTLIDTGYTAHSISAEGRSLGLRFYSGLLSPDLIGSEQIEPFLERFGLMPHDISTVIVTHFHADHVSGLAAFPKARFVANAAAWARVQKNSTFHTLRHGVFKDLIPSDFTQRLTAVEQAPRQQVPHLPEGHDIFGDGRVVAIPLPGHADGHFGLAFPDLDTPLLYGTDTQWLNDALPGSARPWLVPRLISEDYSDVLRSSDHVLAFREAGGQVMLCHDDAPSPYDFSQGAVL